MSSSHVMFGSLILDKDMYKETQTRLASCPSRAWVLNRREIKHVFYIMHDCWVLRIMIPTAPRQNIILFKFALKLPNFEYNLIRL
jgi:hypothetical protein